MRARLFRRTFVVGIVVLASGLAAAQAPTQNQPPRGRGFLMGHVVDASDGTPIANAIVSIGGGTGAVEAGLLPTGEVIIPNANRQVIADAGGRFLFRELTSGSYSIRATAPGFMPGAFGASRPGGLSQTVVLERNDDRKGGLVIKLWRSASITGRIVDEFGEPAIGLQVRIYRRTFTAGRPRLSSTGGIATTDDRGIYRVTNLTPAEYIVSLPFSSTTMPISAVEEYMQAISTGGAPYEQMSAERSMSGAPFPSTSGFRVGDYVLAQDSGRTSGHVPAPSEDGQMVAVPTTFYPGTTSVAQATVLTLASGEDRTGIDFQIRPRRAVRVSGIATGPDGPVANLGVRLLIAGAEDFASASGTEAATTATDAAGGFMFLAVPVGTYTLQAIRVPRAQAPRSTPTTSIEVAGPGGTMMGVTSMSSGTSVTLPLPPDPTLWAAIPVTVGETDVQNLALPLRRGARLSGRFVFEGGEAPPADVLQRASLSISTMAASQPTQVSMAQKRIEGDGRFATVGYPAGRYSVSANVPAAKPGAPPWRFKYARLGGRDLTDEGLEVGATDIENIELVFGTTTAEINGTVVDAKNQPDPGALVVVMPADSTAWKAGVISSRRIRAARTTSLGAFVLPSLPPGDYFIAAIPEGAYDTWQDPKNLEAISRLATRVSLLDGNKLSQRLTTVTSIK